jgi:hypothetical protein
MEQNGTTWIKMEQDGTSTVQTGGTSSKWTSCSFVAIFGLAGHIKSPFFVTRFALLSFASLHSRPKLPALVFHFLAQSDWPESEDYWT